MTIVHTDRLRRAVDVDRGRLVPSLPPITQIDTGDIHTIVGFLPHPNEDPKRPDRREYLVPDHEGRVQSTYLSANEFRPTRTKSEIVSKEVSIFPGPMLAGLQRVTETSTAGQISRGSSRNQFRVSFLASRAYGSC